MLSVLIHSVLMQGLVQAGAAFWQYQGQVQSAYLGRAASCQSKQSGLILVTAGGRTGWLLLSGLQSRLAACSAPTIPSIPDFVRFDRACCPLLFIQTAFRV